MSTIPQEMPPELAAGEWAIVELLGHSTLIGRISEVERFGVKMLAIEPLFNGRLLPPVFQGGASIYRLTPCTAAVAWFKQPTRGYQLPAAILVTVSPEALPERIVETPLGVLDHDDFNDHEC